MPMGPNLITDGLLLALDAANMNSYPGATWKDLSGTVTSPGNFIDSATIVHNSRALSALEVLQNYNATKNRFGL